jgi:large subunit ribosomal protein L17
MRHRVAGRHLGRPTDHRLSLYRNLVTDLLRYERITTTEAKAKEIRPMAEKMITLGKRGDLHARRQAQRFVYDEKVVKRIFDEIAPRLADRPGGYTRITAMELRKGDGARMATIELIDFVDAAPTPRPQRVTAAPAAAPRPAASVTPPVVPPSVPEEMGVAEELTEPAEQDHVEETTAELEEPVAQEEAEPQAGAPASGDATSDAEAPAAAEEDEEKS